MQYFSIELFQNVETKTTPSVIFLPEFYRDLAKNNENWLGFSPTPIHGRTCFVTFDDGQIWAIKGVGWSFGPPYFLQSPKDKQLYFGLYDKRDAERELAVSNWLSEHGIRSARVAGFVEIPSEWVERISNKKPLTYLDGTPLTPVQQYTKTITPYRVADLAYCNDARKLELVNETAGLCGWSSDINDFIDSFTLQLIETVLHYHSLDCVNDSLSLDNCTLAAEPIDYEWFSVPNIVLPDGSDPTIRLTERQQKELIYIGEISIQLAALLETSITMISVFEIIRTILTHQYPNRVHLYKNFFETAFSHVV